MVAASPSPTVFMSVGSPSVVVTPLVVLAGISAG